MRLKTTDHSRDVAGLRYVYPVVSRRAGGVSLGVNLNPNNACNWQCVYCQVPNLVRGSAPAIDLEILRSELDGMLTAILDGDYLVDHVDEPYRRLADIAISGNGEPTSSEQFADVILGIEALLAARGIMVKIVVISNGSLVHQPRVQEALSHVARLGGELWFKLDTATDEGLRRINDASVSAARHLERLDTAARLCPTWIQTCVFGFDGRPPSDEERSAYLAALRDLVDRGTPIEGVLLYGLARPSMQPDTSRLSRLDEAWMARMEESIAALGITVFMSW